MSSAYRTCTQVRATERKTFGKLMRFHQLIFSTTLHLFLSVAHFMEPEIKCRESQGQKIAE